MPSKCPGPERWIALYGGELDEAETEGLARHLLACPRCQAAFDALCDRGAQIAGAFADARVAAHRAPRPRSLVPARRRPRWGVAVAAAAGFVLALAGAFLLAPKEGTKPVAVRPVTAPAPADPGSGPPSAPPGALPPAPRPPVEPPAPAPPRPDPVPPAPVPVPRPAPSPDPVPAPEVKPPPASPPPPPTPRTVAAAATFERVTGEVLVLDEPASKPPSGAKAGQTLHAEQGVQCVGKQSAAVIAFADGTRFELGPETVLRGVRDRQPPGSGRPIKGKSAFLARGALTARVPGQPAGEPLVISTPHGEARVLGTTLKLVVEAGEKGSTRLEVREGRVRLTRRDGRGTDVAAGHFAVAAPGAEPAARPIPRALLLEDFEDPRTVGTRWEVLKDGFPASLGGNLEIDLSPRPPDFYKEKNGPIGGAITRAAFRLPVRVSADAEITWDNSGLWAALFFVPAEDERQGLWVERSGTTLAVGWSGRQERVERPGGWPRRERWTAELDAQDIRFSVNDREVLKVKHGLDPGESCRIRLEANGRIDSPRNARVRFDNVRVDELPSR